MVGTVATELGKPVMMHSWIDYVWKVGATSLCSARDDAIICRHRLPIFHETNISISQIELHERQEIERLTEIHGGAYVVFCIHQ